MAYTHKIAHFSEKPINYGALDENDARNENGTLFVYRHKEPACGESVTLYWIVDSENKSIIRAKFESFGTFAARAVYDMMCMILRTKSIESIEKTIEYQGLERFIRDNPADPALPDEERYLITFAVEAAHKAAAYYLTQEHKAETIVCKCHCVSKEAIEEAIRKHDLKDIAAIGDFTRAGRGCRSCIDKDSGFEKRDIYLTEILSQTREAIEKEKKESAVDDDTPFEALELPQKIAYVNRIVDEHIRHFLVMDGGDMEILDIKENGHNTDIYIRYLGACSGCASSATGTLFAIENILKEKLGPNVRVLPL